MVELRLIRPEDKELLFKWRNSPEIYENAFNKRTVTKEEHNRWFKKILVGPHLAYILKSGPVPVGHLRFDLFCSTCTVSIYLTEGNRSKGLGAAALMEGMRQCKERGIKTVYAYVVGKNARALKFFKKCGFEEQEYVEGCWKVFRQID